MNDRILIVEDERGLCETLEYALQRERFHTDVASTGQQALMLAASVRPDLVLLDWMLPDTPGTQVCLQLRANQRTRALPVVMMTARAAEVDRIVGFEVGADDYVTKPFSVRELVLRIRAVLRRCALEPDASEGLVFGRLRVDPPAHRAWVDGAEVTLTPIEFRLLVLLLGRRGCAQTRETLRGEVWGFRRDISIRTVDRHIERLRDKLGAVGEYVRAARNVGYRFIAEPDEAPDLESFGAPVVDLTRGRRPAHRAP